MTQETKTHCSECKQLLPKESKSYFIMNGFVGNTILWWAVGAHGYTTDLSKAMIVDEKWQSGRPQDKKIEVSLACNLVKSTVDIEDLRSAQRELTKT